MPEIVRTLKKFLNENGANHQVVYILNTEDDSYYTIDGCKIDSEGDVILDISPSNI